jgi:DNA-binding MarR family transcriptional regulator
MQLTDPRMADDIISKMGFLCLGSRMKRIGERMQADVQRYIEQTGLDLQPAQCPVLIAIDQEGSLTIGELAEAVGVSQPGITRSVAGMIEMGLLAEARSSGDQRQKTVILTAAGKRAIERSKREIWPHIEAAVAEICAELKGPLLVQLAQIERGLAEAPLDQRATARLAKRQRKDAGAR